MTFINGDGIRKYCVSRGIPYSDVDHYERYLDRHPIKDGIFVTHNGDRVIDESAIKYAEKYNITHWYCQNLMFSNPRFIPIPIGIENDYWYKEINKPEILLRMSGKISECIPSKQYYANFSIGTNQSIRLDWAQKIRSIEGVTDKISSTVIQNKESYQRYCEEILDHQYIFCPPGNGVDTHRFWEAVILGRIPIVANIEPYISFSKIFKVGINGAVSSINIRSGIYLKFWINAISNKMSCKEIYNII